jgi:hypothetical protein
MQKGRGRTCSQFTFYLVFAWTGWAKTRTSKRKVNYSTEIRTRHIAKRHQRDYCFNQPVWYNFFHKKYAEIHVFWKLHTEFSIVKKSTGKPQHCNKHTARKVILLQTWNFPAIAIRLSLVGFGTQIGCRMLLRKFQISGKISAYLKHKNVINW